jgi:DNA repair exonuclease SbcCD ATPase subunit
MKRFHVFVAAIVFTVLVSSCAKTPDEQVQQAEAALEAAEEAGAQRYAPDAWRRAKESMERLNAELSVQEEKFRLFRNFKTARILAEEALSAADQAKDEAESKKAQLRAEIAGMIADVKGSLQSARNQLSGLTATAALSTTSLRSKLDEAGRLVDKAQLEMDGQRFDSAMASASEARDMIVDVLRTIERLAPRPAVKKR